MMTKQTSRKVAVLKQIATLISFAAITFLFSFRSYSQAKPESSNVKHATPPYGTGAPKELLREYDSTLHNMTIIKTLKDGKKTESIDMSKCNLDRMANIYYLMNKDQRDVRIKATGVSFSPTVASPTKKSPTATHSK